MLSLGWCRAFAGDIMLLLGGGVSFWGGFLLLGWIFAFWVLLLGFRVLVGVVVVLLWFL